jgi:hypothetical protein
MGRKLMEYFSEKKCAVIYLVIRLQKHQELEEIT